MDQSRLELAVADCQQPASAIAISQCSQIVCEAITLIEYLYQPSLSNEVSVKRLPNPLLGNR